MSIDKSRDRAEKILKIIKNAEEDAGTMLLSVYKFNYAFTIKEEEKEMLEKIIEAMSKIDRKYFVSSNLSHLSYDDNALPIGKGQTISQPSTVARMLLLAELDSGLNILEIGCGSGWNAALIAYIVKPGKVVTVDRIPELAEKAKKNVSMLEKAIHEQLLNLSLVAENALNEKSTIWKRKYDRIIITAGISNTAVEEKIKKLAENYLTDNGILVCPYTSGPFIIYKKEKGRIKKSQTKEEYAFVPLLDGAE